MSRRREWWQDVFNRPAFLELYRQSGLAEAPAQVDGVLALLNLHSPARVLDVCCGYGRHSVELARRGFDVTGVDISPVQVAQAVAHACASQVRPRFVLGDVRSIPVRGSFDAALNMFLSFGYFATDAESQAMLNGVAHVLRPGGRLLIDFWNREHELRAFQPVILDRRGDDILEIEEWSFDPLAGRLNWSNLVVYPDGRRERWDHSIRAFTVAEVRMMLEAAGLRLAGLYGGLDGTPYTMDSEAAVFVAERA